MKKFFTLCLALMLASLLNVNAQTYSLVGTFNNWNEADTKYDFSTNGDAWTLSGIDLPQNAEFKVVKNHSWDVSYGGYIDDGKGDCTLPKDIPYVLGTGSDNLKVTSALSNCTLTFSFVNDKAVLLLETDSYYYLSSKNWGIIGNDALVGSWGTDVDMTCVSTGVYEWWTETLPQGGFKVRADDSWNFSFGTITSNAIEVGKKYNLLMNGDNLTIATPSENYSKYCFRLCALGGAATLEVIGFKEAVPSLTRVFYESFDGVSGTGGNDDDKWSDNDANTDVSTSAFDNKTGWSVTKGYAGNKCIKLGTASAIGTITSPALGVTGNAELRFKAGAWNNDSKTLTITINNGGTLSASSVTLVNNAFTDYTISISDATPESTITFSAAKANKNRFFLDEVEVYANSSELSAAEITLNGVMKDAETAYYHGSLANPTVTVTLPAGATYMDVEVDNSGYITESRKNQTSDCTIPFYNAGNYTVRVTAYGEGVYSVASKDIAIETVSSVYTFDELINKGEGATCYLNFSPTVVAHIGKYLYLDGYDMWEGIRSSALVYASLDKTYKKGDVLKGFIATVSYYEGNPQLTPLTTSLGEPYSYSEPYVYEVEAGEAWKAFAEEANVK